MEQIIKKFGSIVVKYREN